MKILFQDIEQDSFETLIIKNIIKNNDILHSCIFVSINDLDKEKKPYYNEYIPIGTIDFVQKWLSEYKNVNKMEPIEIPDFLRKPEYLKRDYSIVNYFDLPTQGLYFIKDASVLKNGSYSGYMEDFKDFQAFKLDKQHKYVVSEFVKILSEYRVYIIDGEIVNISNYNGDSTIFPDVNFIKKVDNVWKTRIDYPKSYSFDVMVTNKGTSLIECHAFVSLGLYSSIWSDSLIYAYRDGINYYINHVEIQNKK